MEQPTKEEIDDMIATINRDGLEGLTRQEVRELCDAYLALREEVGEIMDRRMELISMCEQLQAENQGLERCVVEKINRIGTLAGKIQQLQADNEALRARLGNNILEA